MMGWIRGSGSRFVVGLVVVVGGGGGGCKVSGGCWWWCWGGEGMSMSKVIKIDFRKRVKGP